MPGGLRIKLHPFDFSLLVILSWFCGGAAFMYGVQVWWMPAFDWVWLPAFLFWLLAARKLVPWLLSLVFCPSCPKCRHPVVPHEGEQVVYRCPACEHICDTSIINRDD